MGWRFRLRGRKPRVLFTVWWLEHPPAGGPFLRTQNSIKALASVAELHVVCRRGELAIGGSAAVEFLRGLCASFEFAPYPDYQDEAGNARFVVARARERKASVIWFGHGQVSHEIMKEARSLDSGMRLVCDSDSVWSRFVSRGLPFAESDEERLKILADAAAKEAEEAEWVKFCDIVTAVSEVDAAYYRNLAMDGSKIRLFANGIDLRDYEVTSERPAELPGPYLLLAGYFGPRSPTDQAARWFIEEVLPRVVARRPAIRLVIAGRGSRETLADVRDPRVTVVGQLASLVPYLQHASVSLVPLWFESGTRFKILEAGACGVPVVSTTLGAEGLPVCSGDQLLIADNAESFAESVLSILEQPNLGRALGNRLRELVRRDFSVESLAGQARGVLESLA